MHADVRTVTLDIDIDIDARPPAAARA